MNTSTIIIIVAIAIIAVAIAVVSKHSRHRIVYHENEIAAIIDKVFTAAGTNEMDREKFLRAFQLKINCSHKDLLYLFGKARTSGLIIVDSGRVSKPA